MKHRRISLVVLVLAFTVAAYIHSWWLVMCGLFLFVVEYAAQEFGELKQRLTRIEEKVNVSKD